MLCRQAGVCLSLIFLPGTVGSKCGTTYSWHLHLQWLPIVSGRGTQETATALPSLQGCGAEAMCKRAVCCSLLCLIPSFLCQNILTYPRWPSITVNAAEVLPLAPSDARSTFWGRDTFVTAGRGNEALPGCVPQWDTITTSFCWCFSRPHIKMFSHFWTILLQSKCAGMRLLGAGSHHLET